MRCPHCGLEIPPKRRPALATAPPPNLADLTDKALYAYYAKTAPAKDIEWYLAALDPHSPLAQEGAQLATSSPNKNTAGRWIARAKEVLSPFRLPSNLETEFWEFVRAMPQWYRIGQSAPKDYKITNPPTPEPPAQVPLELDAEQLDLAIETDDV